MTSSNVVIDFAEGGELPEILLDEEQLKRVFVNLIENAAEAFETGHDGGRIEITTRHDQARDIIVIEIADNGKGFNFQQEQLAHHGLGLQNIFKRMDMIGGKAEINSVLQEGTTLLLTIPYV